MTHRSSYLRSAIDAPHVLVVDASAEAQATAAKLSSIGLRVVLAQTYYEAVVLLTTKRPRVVLTNARVNDHDGLHIVILGQAHRSTLAAVVVSDCADPVVQREAEALGATFITRPVTPADLLGAVLRAMFQGRRPGVRTAIRPPFERRAHDWSEHALAASAPDARAQERRRPLPWW